MSKPVGSMPTSTVARLCQQTAAITGDIADRLPSFGGSTRGRPPRPSGRRSIKKYSLSKLLILITGSLNTCAIVRRNETKVPNRRRSHQRTSCSGAHRPTNPRNPSRHRPLLLPPPHHQPLLHPPSKEPWKPPISGSFTQTKRSLSASPRLRKPPEKPKRFAGWKEPRRFLHGTPSARFTFTQLLKPFAEKRARSRNRPAFPR